MPMPKARGQACEELKDEIGPLTDWIAARKAEAVPFLVLGDFNRWMNKGDTFLASLLQAAPMSRATEGQSSPCWGQRELHRSYSCRRRGRDLDAIEHVACPDLSGDGSVVEGPVVRPLPRIGAVSRARVRKARALPWTRKGCGAPFDPSNLTALGERGHAEFANASVAPLSQCPFYRGSKGRRPLAGFGVDPGLPHPGSIRTGRLAKPRNVLL